MIKKLSISVDKDKIIVSYLNPTDDKKIEIGMEDKMINGEKIYDCFFSDVVLSSKELIDIEYTVNPFDYSLSKESYYIIENIKEVLNSIKESINQEMQKKCGDA